MEFKPHVRLAGILTAGLLVLVACTQQSAAPASAVSGAAASTLDADRLGRIETVLQDEVDKGVRGGFVALVTDRDGVVYETAVGKADPYNDIPMQADTRFRVASMTKPIVTAGVMQLVDRGVIRLNDPVGMYIPGYANAQVAIDPNLDENGEYKTRPAARPMTIHDLLTHTSGVGYIFSGESDLDRAYVNVYLENKDVALAELTDKIAELPLYDDPGTRWRYSYSIDIVGRVIEVATGQSLEDYLTENIFKPLGMKDTAFLIDKSDFDRLAVVNEFDEDGKMFRSDGGQLSVNVNEQGIGFMSGGAGLVSTARDYGRFTRMLLNGGELDGARILSPATVRLMMSENVVHSALPQDWQERGVSFGLGGAVILKPGLTREDSVKGEWGWSGYWDTWFIVDPKDGVSAVLMAQTEPTPTTPPSRARDLVKAIAYGALER